MQPPTGSWTAPSGVRLGPCAVHRKRGMNRWSACFFGAFVVCAAFAQTSTDEAGKADRADGSFYGAYYRSRSLWEAAIGKYAGLKESIRFKARYTGQVDAVRVYFMVSITAKPGYSLGDGGDIRCRLQADDGRGLPSGKTLAEFTVSNAAVTLGPQLVRGTYWGKLHFASPGRVEAGRIYHLLWDNLDTSERNWASLDCLSNFEPNAERMQPAYEDLSLAILAGMSELKVVREKTPIYSFYYADGRSQGQAYIGGRYDYERLIQGTNMVRSRFTVTGGDKLAAALYVAVRKSGSPGPLDVRLEEADGKLITHVAVGQRLASATEANWVGSNFDSPVPLRYGGTYNIVLEAPPGDPYYTLPLQDGHSGYGMDGDTFKDGRWEYSTNGGISWSGTDKDLDLMAFFKLKER